ncbi:TPA: chromosome segregation protein ParM [Aeromonas hydrophila]|uniref:chromosome segregation protein ParM n=1 Tax=Aeromonas hydrophila TaxID=644 RepID=UPI002441306B|nr:chromosome segregation protein ParM [Aeromonas hydrophila]
MRSMNKASRLSGIQRLTLRLLLAIEQRRTEPVPVIDLFGMVEKNRTSSTYQSNYRKSCHTLAERGLLALHRTPAFRPAFLLTDAGRLVAIDIEAEAQELERLQAAQQRSGAGNHAQ